MKKFIFLFVVALITNNFYANNLDSEKIKIKDFNFISEVDYEKQFQNFFDETTQITMYLVPMKNSGDLLITYLKDNELIPFFFIEQKGNTILCKDVNNRKDVLDLKINESGKFEVVEFKEFNISNDISLKSCLGQSSTWNCIKYAVNACVNDTSCAFLCGVTVQYCLSAIAISCAASCNTPSISMY